MLIRALILFALVRFSGDEQVQAHVSRSLAAGAGQGSSAAVQALGTGSQHFSSSDLRRLSG